jgi:hypothetical protein
MARPPEVTGLRGGSGIPPKTALLHIGTPKTGTTSIQDCLVRAQQAGALGPYRYPMYRSDRNHNRLTTLYLRHRDLPQVWQAEYPRDDDGFRRARRRYRRFLCGSLGVAGGAILSGESLSNYLSTPLAMRFRSDLESLGFNRFHVVLYVRDPAEFYLSLTQQMLKWSLFPTVVVEDPVTFRYGFRPIAQSWEQVFPGGVIVRPYPGSRGQDVTADFSGIMEDHLGIGLPHPMARLNPTLSAEAMVVIQDYRRAVGPGAKSLLIPDLDRLVAFLAQSGQRISQNRPELKADVAEQIRANHRQDAEFVKARYGVDLGLGRSGGTAALAPRPAWHVESILQTVDPDIVQRLWDEFGRAAPGRRRPGPLRVAERLYRAIPDSRRPARLDSLLRARFARGQQW